MDQNFRRKPARKTPFKKSVAAFLLACAIFTGFLGGIAKAAQENEAETALMSLAGFSGVVIGDVCNLRQGPSTDYPVVGSVNLGAKVTVLESSGQWLKVEYGDKKAYVAGWLVDIDLEGSGVRSRVVKTDVNLRTGPGLDFGVAKVAQKDSVYPARAKRDQWVKISVDGRALWVNDSLVRLEYPGEVQKGGLLVYPAGSSLSVTQSPILGSDVLSTIKSGDCAALIGARGQFLSVETSSGARGWVYGPSALIKSTKDPELSISLGDSAWILGRQNTATVDASDVNFRKGPGTGYDILGVLQKGDILTVLGSEKDWIKGVSPKGVTGYVAGWLTSGIAEAKSSSFNVTLDASSISRLLTVRGPFQSAVVVPGSDGDSLLISTSEFFETDVEIPLNAYEFKNLKIATSDVTIGLSKESNYSVKTNSPGKVVLEFTPKLTDLAVVIEKDREILTVDGLGYTEPTAKRNGSSVSFFLPGASFTDKPLDVSDIYFGETVKSVNASQNADGIEITAATLTESPYVVRETATGFQLQFLKPGLEGKTIILDPGHDSDDPGAVGRNGVLERDVNWEIAVRLKELLEKAGAVALLTREEMKGESTPPPGWVADPTVYSGSLAKRAAWSDIGDLFISIHNDWHADSLVNGSTAYVTQGTLNYSESERLSKFLRENLTQTLGTQDKGTRYAGFYVTREATSPAALVEVMYLSNANEEGRLRQVYTWETAAQGLFEGIRLYFTPAIESPDI